jgi:hypothetical protein
MHTPVTLCHAEGRRQGLLCHVGSSFSARFHSAEGLISAFISWLCNDSWCGSEWPRLAVRVRKLLMLDCLFSN